MDLIPEDRPPHEISSKTFYKDVIDLSVPRQISDYDKRGYKNMILSVKIHLFGNRHIRLTKEICENDGNFVMSEEFRREMMGVGRIRLSLLTPH